ncbi:unnamed protein product [Mesocestoides corti]|uniref:Kinetochore protein SPC25 n=1 Tax=Mesocestoides corti TaxID=53468 RepID=A0A0R3UFP3_MESCO|nr:unnamed protein product [Mesocestoides corti]
MAEETGGTTMFLFGQQSESPDTVLHRFQRLICLEQEEENKKSGKETRGGGWTMRLTGSMHSLQEAKKSLEQLSTRHQKLQREIGSLANELKQLRDQRDALRDELDLLTRQTSDTYTQNTAVEAEIQRLQGRVSVYEKAFGLQIKRTKNHGNIQVVMRGCSPENYDLPSCLILKPVPEETGGQLELVRCNPPIPDIDRLLNLFNQTGDFRSFLLVVRSRFLKYFQLQKK